MYSLFISTTKQIDKPQNAFIFLTNDIRHFGVKTFGMSRFLSKKNWIGIRENSLVIELDKSIVQKRKLSNLHLLYKKGLFGTVKKKWIQMEENFL